MPIMFRSILAAALICSGAVVHGAPFIVTSGAAANIGQYAMPNFVNNTYNYIAFAALVNAGLQFDLDVTTGQVGVGPVISPPACLALCDSYAVCQGTTFRQYDSPTTCFGRQLYTNVTSVPLNNQTVNVFGHSNGYVTYLRVPMLGGIINSCSDISRYFVGLVPDCKNYPAVVALPYQTSLAPVKLVDSTKPYAYTGCFTTTPSGSSLRSITTNVTGSLPGLLTPGLCAAACQAIYAPVSVMEFGKYCYCGQYTLPTSQVIDTMCSYGCFGNLTSSCGGNGYVDAYFQTLPTAFVDTSSSVNVIYRGCYSDSSANRTLPVVTNIARVTPASCVAACITAGYVMAGVEYGSECYCYIMGNAYPTTSATVDLATSIFFQSGAGAANFAPSGTCNIPCAENPAQICGGVNFLSIYSWSAKGLAVRSLANLANYQDGNFQTVSYANCYSDSSTSRTLPNTPSNGPNGSSMTVQQCAYACSQSNYSISGVEYGSECYCGSALPSSSLIIPSTTSTGCWMACNGNINTYCGGGNAISVNYNTTVASASYTGCGTTSTAPLTLTVTAGTNTPDLCGNLAAAAGYRSFAPSGSTTCYVWAANTALSGSSATCTLICGGSSLKYCGSATANVYQVYSIVTTNLPTTGVALTTTYTTSNGQTFTYQGCVVDSMASRTLANNFIIGSSTIPNCIAICANQGFIYAGVEYGAECWCGNAPTTTTASTNCIMACKGDAATSCGGGNALQLYKSTAFTGFTVTPALNVKNEAVTFLGCFADSVNARIFPLRILGLGAMTPTLCTNACSIKFVLNAGVPISYPFAGLQYGSECWCSTTAPSNPIQTILCTAMACSGASTSWCGGGNKMVVYQSVIASSLSPLTTFGTATHSGCYTTAVGNTPSQYTVIASGAAQLNAEYCITACSSLGFAYAALQGASSAAVSCKCSQSVNLGTAAASTACNTPCPAPGFTLEQCGASAYSNVWVTGVAGSILTIAGGSASTFATGGTYPTTASFYVGCYVDSSTRVLGVKGNLAGVANSPAACISVCAGMNLQYAGLEYGSECWCGSSLPSAWTGNPTVSSFGAIGDCNMTCPGATTLACGAGYRLSVYSTGGIVTAPTVQSTIPGFVSVGGVSTTYTYLGCYPDNYPTSRTLKNAVLTSGGNTPQTCAAACFAAGYKYAGLEFSIECYCSNILSPIGGVAVTANVAVPSPCNLACGGDSTKICGGSNYLTVYLNTQMVPTNLTPYAINGVTWTYQACWREPSGGRALSTALNNAAKTIQGCLTLAGTTYNTCGLEYGGECWCGNAFPTTGAQISEAYCSSYTDGNGVAQVPGMVCTGNTLQWCGAGNVLNIYTTYTPSPVITQINTNPS